MRSGILSIAGALVASGLVVLAAGGDPAAALRVLVVGALGSGEALTYTLYYATSFIFAGLAVAVAFVLVLALEFASAASVNVTRSCGCENDFAVVRR